MSPYYERRLAKYGKYGISIAVPNIEHYNINDILNTIRKTKPSIRKLYGLKFLLWLESICTKDIKICDYHTTDTTDFGGDIKTRRHSIPYIISIYRLYKRRQDLHERWSTLEPIWLDKWKGGEILETLVLDNNAPEELHIITNDLSKPITLISQYLDDYDDESVYDDIIDLLTIDEDVYELMQVCGDIQIPRTVELNIVEPGEQANNIFDKITYEEDDWYLSSLMTRKQHN